METLTGQFVRQTDGLREHLGLTHQQFVSAIGRDLTEWSHLRAGRRAPSIGFVRAVRDYARGVGGGWPEALDEAFKRDAMQAIGGIA